MSDLLQAAADALGTPADLVQRSAAARAEVSGSSIDEILASWAGGAPITSSAPVQSSAAAEPGQESSSEAAAAEAPTPTPVAVIEEPRPPQIPDQLIFEEELQEPLEPVAFGDRLRAALRIGAWTGGILGLVGFLIAAGFWAKDAAVLPDIGPIAQVDSTGILIGAALISIVFGAIVAGLSRAAIAWANPAMQLSGSRSSTTWVGAVLGLVLGLVGGAILSGLGTAIEGSDGLIQLPILQTLGVMLIGGAVLGATTAAVPQVFGTPVALAEGDEEEVAVVKTRLGNAVGIPMVGALLLVILVLPFAYILIESNHVASGGAAVIAILVASGILGFAALAGTKPEMRISLGDLLVAVAGIGTVLLIIVAVLLFNSDSGEESPQEGQAAVVLII